MNKLFQVAGIQFSVNDDIHHWNEFQVKKADNIQFTIQCLSLNMQKYGLEKTVVPVSGCRSVGKKDMVYNSSTPELTVDPETYKVTVDGEEITSKPAEKLPLTQLYSLF